MTTSTPAPTPAGSSASESSTSSGAIELLASDLNSHGGVYCPSAKAHMPLWSSHPRVYLDIARAGEAKCPYCGTVYRLKPGEHCGAAH